VLRVSDDVRVVASRLPQLAIDSPDTLSIDKDFQLAFINSGNRPAIILGYQLVVDQPYTETYCRFDATRFLIKVQPVIVKASEIVNVTVKLDGPNDDKTIKRAGDRWTIPVKGRNLKEDFVEVQMCLEIDLATPTNSYESVKLKLHQQSGRRAKDMPLIDNGDQDKRPIVLIHRSATIFSD